MRIFKPKEFLKNLNLGTTSDILDLLKRMKNSKKGGGGIVKRSLLSLLTVSMLMKKLVGKTTAGEFHI